LKGLQLVDVPLLIAALLEVRWGSNVEPVKNQQYNFDTADN
jgi:hypothetical protein